MFFPPLFVNESPSASTTRVWRYLLPLVVLILTTQLFVRNANAANASVSINFVGQGTAMAQTETAGVVAKAYWNNASGASNSSGLALIDEAGLATTATVKWTSDNLWVLPITDQPGNVRMMRGYLDTGSGHATTATVAGLSAGTYDIYVYVDGDNGSNTRAGAYQISGTGITTTSVNLTDAASTNFNGTFTQATGANGNYVKFSSIVATGFTITATPGTASDGTKRAPLNSIQIILTGPPPPTYSVSGNIAGGAGASVALSGTASANVTADNSGNFTFNNVNNGNYTVTPSLTGYSISPTSLPANVSGAPVTGLSFTATALPPATYSISGTITGGSGATVTLTVTSTGVVSATATADGSGNYTFSGVLSGGYTVTPTLAGYTMSPTSRAVTITSSNVSGVNFTSSVPTYTISGTVSGGSSATVTLSGTASKSTTANSSGAYSFTGLVSGPYTVAATKSGYVVAPASQPVTITTSNVTNVNFTAGQVHSISGTISGGAGVTVALSGKSTATTTANSSGAYTFSGLLSGSYVVTPSQPYFTFSPATKSVTLGSSNVTGVNFSVLTYTISGTVSNGSRATVTLSGAASKSTTASTSGAYSFTGLTGGVYTVTPVRSGYIMVPGSQTITINGASNTTVNFTAALQTYSISGTLTGGAGATVALSGAASAATVADSSGNFTFSGLVNGKYTVTPSMTGLLFTPLNLAVTINGADVPNVNFTSGPTYTASGTITGSNSASPLDGATGVTLTLSGAGTGTAISDTSGNFSFPGLPDGTYTITPNTFGYVFTPPSQTITVADADFPGIAFTVSPAPNLIFADEFNGSSLSSSWAALSRFGDPTNNEQQCYDANNTQVANGNLTITTKVQTETCSNAGTPTTASYTSDMVMWPTFNFTYGTIEFKAEMAGGKGTWPAIWLLGSNCQQAALVGVETVGACNWPMAGSDEIDITEIKNAALTTVWQNVISGNTTWQTCKPTTTDTSKNFHVYQLVWGPGSLVWKIDGNTTCTFTQNIPSNPMFMMINTAVGGDGGGTIVPSTFPQSLTVDYVRITQ